MNKNKVYIIICTLLLLVGCGGGSSTEQASPLNIEQTNYKNKNTLEQELSHTAKRHLSENDDITLVRAVNAKKDLIIGFEIHHLNRFNLKKMRKDIQKEMDKKFPDANVIVSTDKKIILELKRLEEKIFSDSITKKELDKKIKALVKLDKEQT